MRYLLLAVFFLGIITVSGCDPDDDAYLIGGKNAVPITAILSFIPTENQPSLADSSTAFWLKIQITQNAAASKRTVSLSSTLGTFPNGDSVMTVTVNSFGNAMVPLISNKPGIALVRAAIEGVSVDTSTTFKTAYPDDMTIKASAYIIDSLSSTMLTVKLFKNVGKVSDPQKVFFEVKPDIISTIPLHVTPFVLSSGKKAIANVDNPFHSTGWFTINSFLLNPDGSKLMTKSVRIKVEE